MNVPNHKQDVVGCTWQKLSLIFDWLSNFDTKAVVFETWKKKMQDLLIQKLLLLNKINYL